MSAVFDGAVGSYAGYRIVVSIHMSRIVKEMRRVKAHPIICWLARYLPIYPYVEVEVETVVETEAALDRIRGVIYVGPKTYEQLRARAACRP